MTAILTGHRLTIAFLIAAVVLYIAGAALPATAFIVLGAIAECIMWFRIFRR